MSEREFLAQRRVRNSPEVTLRSGLMLHPPFSIDHTGCILYCRYFSNDIYEILPNEVTLSIILTLGQILLKRIQGFEMSMK